MRKNLYSILLATLLLHPFVGQATNTADLDSLLYYIQTASTYDEQTEQQITEAEAALNRPHADRYAIYDELFQLCRSYHFDRALNYVHRLSDYAHQDGSKDKIVHSQVCQGFLYMSAGLFKEGYDLLSTIDTTHTSRETRIEYCITYARLLYDMANYNQAEQSYLYEEEGNQVTQAALQILTPRDNATYWRCMALFDLHQGLYESSIARYKMALQDSTITNHERAIHLSTIAYISSVLGDSAALQHYMIQAAIHDIRSSTKETVATRIVAETLYREGDIDHAIICIKKAQADAQFYNARHRQVEISQILPIIEQGYIQRLRAQNFRINLTLSFLIVVLVALLATIYLFVRRNKQIKQARQTIEEMNNNLKLANKMKEEYIGSFLCIHSEYLSDVEKYQQHIRRAVEQHKYQDLNQIPKSVDAIRQREIFYQQFDEMFLRIFPHFVERFNELLRPEEKIVLKENELLNTDLRIAALIRLGIHHNEVIAQVLDYSINTIYTYKTKLKNRSNLTNEEFLKKLMEIS